MTDTIKTEIAASGTDQPIGTLEHLDPTLLDIGDNVRDDAALSKPSSPASPKTESWCRSPAYATPSGPR